MLRRSLVALMMGAICAGSAMGDDTAAKQTKPAQTGLVGWLKGKSTALKTRSPFATPKRSGVQGTKEADKAPAEIAHATSGIERAVVQDAERQAVTVRQTAGVPQDSAVYVNEQPFPTIMSASEPVEIQQAPPIPNLPIVTGPQYFSPTQSGMSNPIAGHPSENWQTYNAPLPMHFASQGQVWNVSNPNTPTDPPNSGADSSRVQTQGTVYSQPPGGRYPQTGAALYPCPRPGIPHQIGGAAIMNQALHPHEMLYAHRYRAMYPPYYYKVNGGWIVTPFGIWSREDWHLQGTQVDVKYKSHISPFAHFKPPYFR